MNPTVVCATSSNDWILQNPESQVKKEPHGRNIRPEVQGSSCDLFLSLTDAGGKPSPDWLNCSRLPVRHRRSKAQVSRASPSPSP